ncbi:transmembrane protein 255A [Willisornis vidua]|uniref:Transmembrane protein 255A n=1 Tax=Willisornis vidua TaxID=1566151 RepID=A0ABQ9D9I5_9PASS|nr:transmembrane protein 255A [Willisornis vidua]
MLGMELAQITHVGKHRTLALPQDTCGLGWVFDGILQMTHILLHMPRVTVETVWVCTVSWDPDVEMVELSGKEMQLVASIVFISFGVIAAFCCAIVDGVFAARHIDLRPLYAGRCQYYSKSTTPPEWPATVEYGKKEEEEKSKLSNEEMKVSLVKGASRVEISGGYYEYIDVSSCQDIIHLYHLLWSATILNIVGLFLGIITAAILGGFKDMTPSLPTLNCTVENAHPSVSYYSRPQVTSYNTYYHSTPHLPPYSAYDFQHSSVFPASTPSGLSDDPQSLSPSPSYMWASNAPPRYSPPYFPPFEKPPPYTP